MFGLAPKDLITIENLLIQPLKKEHCQLFVFGSRARGDHQKFSDLDVLIVASDNLEKIKAHLSLIQEQLEESELPIKVDIVLEQELAHSYRTNVLKDMIEI